MVEDIKKHMTPVLFAVAYAAFMGVSIPKVGAMFLLYSEQRSPVWVAASYGAAITIDALIGFLTYATTSKQRDRGTQLGIWLFVLIFAAYSFYFNWIYDERERFVTQITRTVLSLNRCRVYFSSSSKISFLLVLAHFI